MEPGYDYLPLGVRAYVPGIQEIEDERRGPRRARARAPEYALVFDTETTVDASQRLNFGCWRYCRRLPDAAGIERLVCVQEGLFYAADLPERDPAGHRVLVDYARDHTPLHVDLDVRDADWHLRVVPIASFRADAVWPVLYKTRGLIVCFNMPFDISRLASNVGTTTWHRRRKATGKGKRRRNRLAGGFSFTLWQYSRGGAPAENRYRPRIAIKSIDSKRALKSLFSPAVVDEEDLVPDDDPDGEPDEEYRFHGHLLDLRTLAFALTDQGHSLESACATFGVPYTKRDVAHGHITPEYVTYCREDTHATQRLCDATTREFLRHPVDLPATGAYSPATIGRAYLQKIRITPILERQPFGPSVLGWSMAAYYGGRAETRIRRTPVPVVYCDFLSMYPTVCSLLGVWPLLTADRIHANTDAANGVQGFLERVTLEDCFEATTWTELLGIALIEPDGDVVPVRAAYQGRDFQIGLNPLHSTAPIWYPIADLVASKLLTGRAPTVLRAVRFAGRGQRRRLDPVALLGDVSIDPRASDFFRTIIEERKRLDVRTDLPNAEREWRSQSLKILANATSYGIYAQMTRHELPPRRRATVAVYGSQDEPFRASVSAPEEPGDYCFPPIAATTTGGARLMLAMLERLVTDAGGTYAFCDTDSMAIVATRHGKPVSCPGGASRLRDGADAIRALTWDEVEAIRARFEALNPYDPDAVTGSVLELEEENYDEQTRERRQLYCYAISAKRYVLYNHTPSGGPELRGYSSLEHADQSADDSEPALRKPSEHGLGHLLNPTDPDDPDRGWIRQAWEWILRDALGQQAPDPPWLDRPAIGRQTVSSPATWKLFRDLNRNKPYAEQIKPFNFLNIAYVSAFERPEYEERIVLVAPYEPDPTKWLNGDWYNRYSGTAYRITTQPTDGHVLEDAVRVKTYRDILRDYRTHPQAKSLDADGHPCRRTSVGLLQRRPASARSITHIGKESNRLEELQAGLLQDPDETLTHYDHADQHALVELVHEVLKTIGSAREVARLTGIGHTAVNDFMNHGSRPHQTNWETLLWLAVDHATSELRALDIPPSADPHGRLAAYLGAPQFRTPRRR